MFYHCHEEFCLCFIVYLSIAQSLLLKTLSMSHLTAVCKSSSSQIYFLSVACIVAAKSWWYMSLVVIKNFWMVELIFFHFCSQNWLHFVRNSNSKPCNEQTDRLLTSIFEFLTFFKRVPGNVMILPWFMGAWFQHTSHLWLLHYFRQILHYISGKPLKVSVLL